MSTNIKYHLIFRPFFRVENPCGKTCGQCGKLMVINRYFDSLHFHTPGPLPNFSRYFLIMFPAVISFYVTGITATVFDQLYQKSWTHKQIDRFLGYAAGAIAVKFV